MIFGVLGMVLAGLDIARFARPPADPRAWWFAHMGGMLGPIGVPLITAWITYYKIRFRGAAGARAEAVTTR